MSRNHSAETETETERESEKEKPKIYSALNYERMKREYVNKVDMIFSNRICLKCTRIPVQESSYGVDTRSVVLYNFSHNCMGLHI